MNENDIERLKGQLLALKEELRGQEEDFKGSRQTVELDQSKVGRLSRMDAMQAQEMALETARRRKIQFLKVDSALNRILSGDYGYCLNCGKEINIRRLSFDPSAALCISCAEALE